VASLLVYFDSPRVQRLLPNRLRGARWTLRAGDFADDIELLDVGASLFVVTVEHDCAVLVAYLEAARAGDVLGDATVCDAEITHLLPRLGCARTEDLPAWADVPRVLPPGDVDLLLTRPPPAEAIALPPPPTPPVLRVVAADPTAARLLAAIYDDLASDAARLVYADYLQEQGDPRGELIALQLANAGPPSQRERELIETCGATCLGAIAPHVQAGYVMRRGFLAACATTYEAIPEAIVGDIAWSTVEELHTISLELLRSPALVSATRIGIDGPLLARAAETEHELPFEVATGHIVGQSFGPALDAPGMSLTLPRDWTAILSVGALTRLRAMSFGRVTPGIATALANSGLGKQLRHLDIHLGDVPVPDIGEWRRVFDSSALHRLTLRCMLVARRQPRAGEVIGPWTSAVQGGPYVCVALERTTDQHRLVVQVDRALSDPQVTQAVRLIAPLGRRIDRIEVQDLDAPDRVATRQRRLIAGLAPMFARVVPTAGPLLAP